MVLWECFLHGFVSDQSISADQNIEALWHGVESFLAQQFPEAERIVTAAYDPKFGATEYQEFSRALSYEQTTTAAYGKKIDRS